VATYVAAIGLFLVSGGVSSLPLRSLPSRAVSDIKVLLSSRLAVAVTVLFLAGVASTLAFFPHDTWWLAEASPSEPVVEPGVEADQSESAQFERWYTSQPRKALVVPADGAKVLVVKFNDYQCPPCRQTYLDYRQVFQKYEASQPGAVRLVLRDFPLEKECNAGVSTEFHAASCEAAAAVRLARAHNRAEALEEWLFANQPSMTPQSVREGARTVGRVPDFDARYQETLEAVKADIAYGRQLGVGSTPTFFINGVMIMGGLPPQLFDQAIAFELQRASK
jgi:protein-disulfide isomerase